MRLRQTAIRIGFVALAAALLLSGVPTSAVADEPTDPRNPDFSRMFIIGFHGDVPADVESRITALGGSIYLASPGEPAFIAVHAPAGETDGFVGDLFSWPEVEYVHNDGPVYGLFTPNDPLYNSQWAPKAVKLPEAWDVTKGDHTVNIAILDTGVYKDHPDLKDNYCLRGPDYSGENWRGMHWHATHVMSIATGIINNGQGVAGAAQACVIDVRVLNGWGSGQWSWIAAGVKWAADNGADIISMSLGGGSKDKAVEEAMTYAYTTKGVLIISAAGNSGCGSDTVLYPAKYPESMAVSSLDSATALSWFSSCGPKVEIAAPGGNILAAMPTGYGYASGTSMATPLVSGVAALLMGQVKALNLPVGVPIPKNLIVRCALDLTSDELGDPGRDKKFGFGRLDAQEMVTTGLVTGLTGVPACAPNWR